MAERLDRHRKDALARDERVTMTGMYNVVEKLRTGDALTPKERTVHEIAACGILRDLHDELDALVARAYGWPWPMEREEILERLVALHDERVAEEEAGHVRWLRPDYQIPRFGRAEDTAPAPTLALPEPEAAKVAEVAERRTWPAGIVDQIAALLSLLAAGPVTAQEAADVFTGARAELVRRHLETLVLTGEARPTEDGGYAPVPEPV